MRRAGHILLLLVLVCSSVELYAALTPPIANNKKTRNVRISIGPVLGFYSINTRHATTPSPRMSALFSFKKEKRFGRDFRTFFQYGVDYFFHGLSFNSYYFKPDSVQLYDKTFAYKYSVFAQEINVPLQVKYSFNRENNSLYSGYFMIGYHLRCFLPGNLRISRDGNTVKTDRFDMKFKTPLLFSQLNSFVSASVGVQRNQTASGHNNYFVELSYRYGFSSYSFEKNYSPSSLFINSSHLALLVGVKF